MKGLMIQLTSAQRNLISRLNVNISTGLSTSEADSRRRNNRHSSSSSASSSSGNTTAVANIVTPPINCPKWICCLLPCIGRTRSMVSFAAVTPDDAEVLRNTHWVRYDAASLVIGDVMRLDVHDVVPADCVIIAYGFHDKLLVSAESEETGHGDDDDDDDDDDDEKLMIQSKASAAAAAVDNNNNYEDEGVLSVDARLITGQSNMAHYYSNPSSSSSSSMSSSSKSLQTLLYGSRIVNGSCIAIVTAIGNDVVLSRLITTRRWPPKYDMSHEIYEYIEYGN